MLLPHPSLHGLGIQPWRSTPPPGRSAPSPRRTSLSPRRWSPSLRRGSPSPRRLSPITGRGGTPFSNGGVGITTTPGFQPWQSAAGRGVFKETWLGSMTPRKEAGGLVFRSTVEATTKWTKALGVQIQEAGGRKGKLKPFREIVVPVGLVVRIPTNLVIGAGKFLLGLEVRMLFHLVIGAKKLLGGPESSSCKMEAIRLCLDPMEFIKPVEDWKLWPPEIRECWPESVARTPAVLVKSPDKRRSQSARVWEWAWVLGPELNLKPTSVRGCKGFEVGLGPWA